MAFDLLPFLDRKSLYDRYKFDEHWDSESNLALVKEGADLFGGTTEDSEMPCAFFLVTGPETAFNPQGPPTRYRTILDGIDKTIALVEAKRSVPWTKPEDIPYNSKGPLPLLGGFFSDGFHVGFLDAHVSFVPFDVDEALLRSLFTKAGRERLRAD